MKTEGAVTMGLRHRERRGSGVRSVEVTVESNVHGFRIDEEAFAVDTPRVVGISASDSSRLSKVLYGSAPEVHHVGEGVGGKFLQHLRQENQDADGFDRAKILCMVKLAAGKVAAHFGSSDGSELDRAGVCSAAEDGQVNKSRSTRDGGRLVNMIPGKRRPTSRSSACSHIRVTICAVMQTVGPTGRC